ncbi:MAG: hypothetical protein H6824_19090 [Planctomycetaceae bacterium]|nr:hypothetical protein [Planctomycetaceae bacterium]
MFPSMHPTNVDLLQRLKSADDRQFGKNMDVCGTVSEYDAKRKGWIKSHLIGLRTDVWTPDKVEKQQAINRLQKNRREELKDDVKYRGRLSAKEAVELEQQLQDDAIMNLKTGDIEQRRLVLKHFKTTTKRIHWVGSIEELSSWEVTNSLAARRPLLSLAVNLSGIDVFTVMQQQHRWLRYPAVYGFVFMDESTHRLWNITVKRKWVSFGADFDIEGDGKHIGAIDGNLIGFGYNAYIDVYEPTLAQNSRFMDVLTLFTSSVGFHKGIWKSIKRRMKLIRAGQWFQNSIDLDELRLLEAPRRRSA